MAYANALGNGFALDDAWFIVGNPVVTEGRFAEAFTQAAWPGAVEGSGNYRPLTLASFAAEWGLWGDAAFGFHLVSLLAHAAASLLVLALLARFVPRGAALVGALFFAVHPVHVEAVANVMGRSELYAAVGYLGAVLVYLEWRPERGPARAARLLTLVGLFALALTAKEITVTLPAILIALEVYRRADRPMGARLVQEGPTYVALVGVLACYVILRWNVLGDLTGESAAAGLLSLGPGERTLTALTVWPHYLRLMVFPLDLVADYGPDVLGMSRSVTPEVVLGGVVFVSTVLGALLLRVRAPVAGLGLAWFVIAVSPVSNLVVRSDILLAERTLYLPSVGASLVVAAVAAWVMALESARTRRVLSGCAIACAALLIARTTTRNPTWADTPTVLRTLAAEHPESWLAHRGRAIELGRAGDHAGAARAYDDAIRVAPDHYQLLVNAATVHDLMGDAAASEALLVRAIELMPNHPEAYRRLAEQRLLRGDGRAAHATALEGLERAGDEATLWALVSESYVAKGDLEAALRAREAAVLRDTTAAPGWLRLAQLLDAMDRPADALGARRRAEGLAQPPEGRE